MPGYLTVEKIILVRFRVVFFLLANWKSKTHEHSVVALSNSQSEKRKIEINKIFKKIDKIFKHRNRLRTWKLFIQLFTAILEDSIGNSSNHFQTNKLYN